jgi:hypothetical protein
MTNADQLYTRVVRALGASRAHVVDAHPDQFRVCRWMGSSFIGLSLPLATRCGALLRGKDSAAVCMEPGTRVTCAQCRRLTGIERAGDDNHLTWNGLDAKTVLAIPSSKED